MRCIIVANGIVENYKRFKTIFDTKYDLIISADGGLKHLNTIDVIPHIIVGDMDSVDDYDFKTIEENKVEIHRLPHDKNETDTEIAIDIAVLKGVDEIVMVGVTGGRLDHTMANIGLLKEIYDRGIKAEIKSDFNDIIITDRDIEIYGNPGDIVSIIPVSEKVTGVTLIGLEYPLTNKELLFGAPRGISNVFLSDRATVKVQSGYLLIMKVV